MTAPAREPPPAQGRRDLVVVVDDDADMRESMEFLLGARGMATAGFATAEDLLASGIARSAACLVADVRLGPGMDGVALVEELRRRRDAVPVVVVTGHADVPLAVRAMRAGAADFVEKPFGAERMLSAIAGAVAAASGKGAGADAGAGTEAARVAALTLRERQVLEGLVAGKANKAVAHDLGISPRTVEAYRADIMHKLRARSFAEAVRIALAAGLGPAGGGSS